MIGWLADGRRNLGLGSRDGSENPYCDRLPNVPCDRPSNPVGPFRQKTCEDCGGKARITPANIHSEATHVLVCARRAGVISRHQVRQVRLASGTEWAMIARNGQMLGYVPADALASIK